MSQASSSAIYQMILKVLKQWLDQKETRSVTFKGLQTVQSMSNNKENSDDIKLVSESSKLSYLSLNIVSDPDEHIKSKSSSNLTFHNQEVSEGLPQYNIKILEPVIDVNKESIVNQPTMKSRASIIDLKDIRQKSRLGTKVCFSDRMGSNQELCSLNVNSKPRRRNVHSKKRYFT